LHCTETIYGACNASALEHWERTMRKFAEDEGAISVLQGDWFISTLIVQKEHSEIVVHQSSAVYSGRRQKGAGQTYR